PEETSLVKGPYLGSGQAIREAFRRKGIPSEAVDTMIRSLSENALSQYSSTLRQWWEFCQLRKFSPFDGNVWSVPNILTIPNIILFLHSIFELTKNSYISFNTHRAALSLITGAELGENVNIKRFMKGIFRTRPTRPKYEFTWNPKDVLNFLRDSPDTDLKSLSYKLATLLVLTTGHRIQTVFLIRCSNVKVSIFSFLTTKTSGPTVAQPCLTLPFFEECPRLCIAACLQWYLEQTKSLRQPGCDNLFITHSKPHGPGP
ncbi:hypothetical protein NQ315_006104, partial [Exocentrus adspersus]